MLTLDKDLLRRQIEAGDIPQVEQQDTSDDLHGVLSAPQDPTQTGGAAIKSDCSEEIDIYPESNAEDRPIIAVRHGNLVLLGGEWELDESKGAAATVEAIAYAVGLANSTLETLARHMEAN